MRLACLFLTVRTPKPINLLLDTFFRNFSLRILRENAVPSVRMTEKRVFALFLFWPLLLSFFAFDSNKRIFARRFLAANTFCLQSTVSNLCQATIYIILKQKEIKKIIWKNKFLY